MASKLMVEIIASYFWVGSISYNSWMPNRLGCRIMVIRSTPPVFLWFCRYYHYTRFGEVLLFLSLKSLASQWVRIMKFIHMLRKHKILFAKVTTRKEDK